MRGGQRARHGDAAGALPRRARGSGALHVAGSALRAVPGRRASSKSARGHMVFSRPCAHCGGTGRQRRRACPACGGRQVEMRTEPLTLDVPAGLADGARIRVPGKGHAGPRRRRARRSLHHRARRSRIRCSGAKATICTSSCRSPCTKRRSAREIDVPSLDGPARLRVPPGTQSGQRFRLRERGVPSPRDGRRGDLSSKSGWCCRSCSTSDRRSCCGSSAGSTARTCVRAIRDRSTMRA